MSVRKCLLFLWEEPSYPGSCVLEAKLTHGSFLSKTAHPETEHLS